MDIATRHEDELRDTLAWSGVPPDWPVAADSGTRTAYAQIAAFEERTGLHGLIKELGFLTPSTYVHTQRLVKAAAEWACAAGLPPEATVELGVSVEAHDIGKLAMAPLIEYTGIYTPEQRQEVGFHPRIGADLYWAVPIRNAADIPTKVQVLMQILCHHTPHDHPDAIEALDIHDTALSPTELHTFARVADSTEALSNLETRRYMRTNFLNGEVPSLIPDGMGGITYDHSALVKLISQIVGLGPETPVLDRSLRQLVTELAGLLPPVLPRNTHYDPAKNIFVPLGINLN